MVIVEQDTFETFKKDILQFIVDKFLHDIFIDDKLTQETFDTFYWDILDVIL